MKKPFHIHRGDQAILAHLYCAAAESRRVALNFGTRAIFGTLDFPDPERQQVGFRPQHALAAAQHPAIGSEGKLYYSIGPDDYWFSTQVRSVDANGRCLCELPQEVHSARPRLTRRHDTHGRWRFDVPGFGVDGAAVSLGVHDLCVAGMSCVFEPATVVIEVGQSLRGELHGPGLPRPIPLLAEVRVVRRNFPERPKSLAGCRFKLAGYANFRTLAIVLSGGELLE